MPTTPQLPVAPPEGPVDLQLAQALADLRASRLACEQFKAKFQASDAHVGELQTQVAQQAGQISELEQRLADQRAVITAELIGKIAG